MVLHSTSNKHMYSIKYKIMQVINKKIETKHITRTTFNTHLERVSFFFVVGKINLMVRKPTDEARSATTPLVQVILSLKVDY